MPPTDSHGERRSSPAAIILAGGESRRMGSPKALLRAPSGEPFATHLIRLLTAECSPVILVLGCGAAEIESAIGPGSEALVVVNPDYALGQLSSLQCGLRAVPAGASGALFTPIDHALVQPATIAAVVAAFRSHPAHPSVVQPQHERRHGHPVCIDRQVMKELLELAPSSSAREVIHRHRARALYVDVDDPATVNDLDDRAAYERAIASLRTK